jgi:hypothetical protein
LKNTGWLKSAEIPAFYRLGVQNMAINFEEIPANFPVYGNLAETG